MFKIKSSLLRSPFFWFSLIVIFVIVFVYKDYGESYDEAVHLHYGDWIIIWFATLGKINAATTAISCKYYGGFADVLMQSLVNIGTMAFSWDHFEERHFLNALLGLMGLFYTYRLGSLLGGKGLGMLAAGILYLTPRWFGHSFDDPKDIPFASAYVASLYYLLRPWIEQKPYDWKAWLKIGVAVGIASGTRIGGVMLYFYELFLLLALAWVERMKKNPQALWVLAQNCLPKVLVAGLVSWTLMILCWPYALLSPIVHPLEVIGVMSNYPWDGMVRFLGHSVPAVNLPWFYVPVWFLISLPEHYFLGLILACGMAWSWWKTSARNWSQAFPYAILVVAILFPFAVIVIEDSTLYDGMRHVMFLVPPLALLTSSGLWFALLRWRLVWFRACLAFLLSLSLTLNLYDLISLHPYQTIYFNRLVAGGVAHALKNFDGDYWGQSYHAGSDWIVQHYPEGSFNVGVPYMAKRLNYYFNRQGEIQDRRQMLLDCLHGKKPKVEVSTPRIRPVGPEWDGINSENGDLYNHRQFKLFMSGTQNNAQDTVPGRVVFTVERQGALLLVVKEVEF